MSNRAKEIAAKIIADVWPNHCEGGFVDDAIRPVVEAAVEKHMPKPHQVRDRDGYVWEQLSNGKYRSLRFAYEFAELNKHAGPLTEVQGEPLPDVAALRESIAELENKLTKITADAAPFTVIRTQGSMT